MKKVKSELCPVTETCTAATMPPASPSTSTSKHKKSSGSETKTTPSRPSMGQMTPRGVPAMPGRIRPGLDGNIPNPYGEYLSANATMQMAMNKV